MATVIEVFSRAGHCLSVVRFESDNATVGRAWDNDVHLDDPYISPHHLRIEVAGSGGWRIIDLETTNGVRRSLSGPRESSVTVQSGGMVWIGHTRLVVLSPSHPVETTRALPTRLWVTLWLDRLPLALVLLVAALGLELLANFLGAVEPFELHRQWQGLLNSAIVYALIAGSWALFGRLFRQESGFSYQLSMLVLMFWGGHAVLWLWAVANYNFGNPASLQWVRYGIVGLALAVWLALALGAASNLSRRVRLVGAAGFACLYLTFQGFIWLAGLDQFHFAPDYDAELLPPIVRAVDGVTRAKFEAQLPAVFEHAAKFARRDVAPTALAPVVAIPRNSASD